MTRAAARTGVGPTMMVAIDFDRKELLAVLGGGIPSGTGWFGVGFNLVFVLAFGYFRFVRPEEA